MGMNAGSGGGETMLAEINVTPFVDVMLVLLIIFMVTAPMIEKPDEKRKVDMDLPVTRENTNRVDPGETDKMILEVTESLEIQVGEEVLTDCSDRREGNDPARFEPCFDEVEKKLGDNPKLEEDETLYILADTEIPYGFVVGTMARIKKAGIHRIGMVTNPEYLQDEDDSGE